MADARVITISMQRFQELLECEIRNKVLLTLIAADKSVSAVSTAFILGNSELAFEIEEANKAYWEGRKNES